MTWLKDKFKLLVASVLKPWLVEETDYHLIQMLIDQAIEDAVEPLEKEIQALKPKPEPRKVIQFGMDLQAGNYLLDGVQIVDMEVHYPQGELFDATYD